MRCRPASAILAPNICRNADAMALRLFAALPLPDEIAASLLPLQAGIAGANWRVRESLHVTLRFFGDTREDLARELDEALADLAGTISPFPLRVQGVGVFGREEPHTLWLGIGESAPLRKLAADIERLARRLGIAPETRKFSPHITLASVRGADRARLKTFEQGHALFTTPDWEANHFGLYSSWLRRGQSSLYRLEADYPFAP